MTEMKRPQPGNNPRQQSGSAQQGAQQQGGQRQQSGGTATMEPHLDSISQDHGPSQGGNKVTLSGSGLAGVSKVKIGRQEVMQVTPMGPNKLQVIIPQANTPGRVEVVAIGASNRPSNAMTYTYD
jgi:hypothetical protein